MTFDPKSGMARILKPLPDFEDYFEGLSSYVEKIPFFEWKDRQPPNPLDPLAGKDGYDPRLLNYVNVPKGATLLFYIPAVVASFFSFYRYVLAFRDSNMARGNQLSAQGQAEPYHIPYEAPGQPDTTTPGATKRFIMPAGLHSIVVHRPEPPIAVDSGGVYTPPATGAWNTSSVRVEALVPRGELLNTVLISAAGLRGVHQQGVADPAVEPNANAAGGQYFEITAAGDQMLLVVDREVTGLEGKAAGTSTTWQFATTDANFSQVYGKGIARPHDIIPELGVYLYVLQH